MIDPNNPPADLVIAITLLDDAWKRHQVPPGTVINGYMTVETAKLHGQRRVDKLVAQLEAAGVHVELEKPQ